MFNHRTRIASASICSAGVVSAALAFGAFMPASAVAVTPDDSDRQASASLPAAKQLVEQAIKAQGGQEAFDAVKSVRTKGTMSVPQMGGINIETHVKSTGEFLIKQTVPQMGTMSMGFDGKTGWAHQPGAGYQLLSEEEAAEVRSMSIMHDLVARISDEFEEMETVERTSFGGADCYKVRVTHKELDRDQHIFFNADTRRLMGVEISQESDFGPMSITMTFSEWKQRDDLTIFTKTTLNQMGMEMVMQIDEIEFNKVDASVFKLPEDVKKMVEEREQREGSQQQDSDG